ncbi:hypothetical protein ASPSYDRAFT_709140 [Aspergillus sydowii CBS 593.65]|uniref:Uncharacterized protein n=1 Tax=Aspergillus sydowii CBS 593.65 TaxID=1036612 RepID=A0A1L9SYY6_9EURO|nr:uncharacterized protein ASPSYDRAFT_709140 [Aspergillus sydowii CBS 593.65]OJJ52243.1 hypothetical protein ASPSYDRAFT_709140 [Aspergillus sydowii CBS 593.65]
MPQDRTKLDQYHLITAMTGYRAETWSRRYAAILFFFSFFLFLFFFKQFDQYHHDKSALARISRCSSGKQKPLSSCPSFHQRGPISVELVVLTHLRPRPVTSKETMQPCCWLFGRSYILYVQSSFEFGFISELQCVKINYDFSAHPITFYYAIMQYNPFRERVMCPSTSRRWKQDINIYTIIVIVAAD